jgi:hypothetical protein
MPCCDSKPASELDTTAPVGLAVMTDIGVVAMAITWRGMPFRAGAMALARPSLHEMSVPCRTCAVAAEDASDDSGARPLVADSPHKAHPTQRGSVPASQIPATSALRTLPWRRRLIGSGRLNRQVACTRIWCAPERARPEPGPRPMVLGSFTEGASDKHVLLWRCIPASVRDVSPPPSPPLPSMSGCACRSSINAHADLPILHYRILSDLVRVRRPRAPIRDVVLRLLGAILGSLSACSSITRHLCRQVHSHLPSIGQEGSTG